MRKILFSVCAVLAIMGCNSVDTDFPCLSCGRCSNPVVSNNSVTCGGQTYRTVRIGSQTWFAENLNYNASGSVCYDNNSSNCAIYGRLYNWSTAMTVCPSGWYLPSDAEWDILVNYAGGSSTAGTKLKAASGWYDCGPSSSGSSYSCEDTYGFSALPGGYGLSDGSFYDVGDRGNWWSATEYYGGGGSGDLGWDMHYRKSKTRTNGKSYLLSVRCVQD